MKKAKPNPSRARAGAAVLSRWADASGQGHAQGGVGLPAWGRWLLALWIGMQIGVGLYAADPAERLAYETAVREYDLGQWERAVHALDEFVAKFPRTEFKADSEQRRLFADAEWKLASGSAAPAAQEFADYQHRYPQEARAALAAVREAQARVQANDRAGALKVLEAADGSFARQLAKGTEPSTLLAGLLLKADLLRGEQRWADAAAALTQAAPWARSPSEQAARWQLVSAVEEGAGHYEAAAQAAEQLWKALGTGASPERLAEASALAGRLWTLAGKPDEARLAFNRNVNPQAPVDRQLEAAVALAEAAQRRGDLAAAREGLQSFLTGHAADPGVPAVRLRLGQILFLQFIAAGGLTNATPDALALLAQSGGYFADGLTNLPPPALAGPLHLGRGWVLWQDNPAAGAADRLREAGTNFAAAATLLPHGPEQAVARLKWADVQLRLGDAPGALTNYLFVATQYADVPSVEKTLVTPALIQAALAAVTAGQADSAAQVVEKLLARQPLAEDVEPSSLLVGQALAKAGQPEQARKVFEKFLAAYPGSAVAAEVELALAGAQLRARDWPGAITSLDRWVAVHTNHALLPRAEFDRAWAAAQAGLMTNAIAQFSALSIRFPTNPIAQTASLWLAGNYFSVGDYARAEQACVNVTTNAAWRGTPEWHQARLWAAEAARQRQSYASAREQLIELLSDRSTPLNLVPSAYFALGETQLEQPPTPDQPALGNYQQALEAFTAAAQFTNSAVAVAAIGKMGDCYLQLASRVTNNYAKADERYRLVLGSPRADLASRCKASVGRGLVAERYAATLPPAVAAPLFAVALNAYLDVVNGTLVRAGEVPDPWWIKEAGREAGRLLESQARWKEAAALYDRLSLELPALKPVWQLRAAEARKRGNG